MISLINGEFTDKISILDRGLHFGDGVFETLRVQQKKPVFAKQHFDRLIQGCERLLIPHDGLVGLLQKDIDKLFEQIVFPIGALKIIITRGDYQRGYGWEQTQIPHRILLYQAYTPNKRNAEEGIVIGIASKRLCANPDLAGIKHLNRLEQVLAMVELSKKKCCQELVLLDNADQVIEGISSNIFLLTDFGLLTPIIREQGILGVMRSIIIEDAEKLQIPCAETPISLSELTNAKGIFMCNSLWGIWPVTKFENQRYKIPAEIRTLQSMIQSYFD